MKYYPLSQIQTGLTAKEGEFALLKGNITPKIENKIFNGTYVGPYFKTSDGKFFTGITPTDPNGVYELQPLSKSVLDNYIQSQQNDKNNIVNKTPVDKNKNIIENILEQSSSTSHYTHEYGYRRLTKVPYYSNAPLPPKSHKYVLKEIDFSKGWLYRYFAKHVTNNNIIEISKETYDQIKNKSKSIQHELYKIMEIKWAINNQTISISEFNTNQIKIATKLGFTGLDQFLKNDLNII